MISDLVTVGEHAVDAAGRSEQMRVRAAARGRRGHQGQQLEIAIAQTNDKHASQGRDPAEATGRRAVPAT